jgi:hypothetical protein
MLKKSLEKIGAGRKNVLNAGKIYRAFHTVGTHNAAKKITSD